MRKKKAIFLTLGIYTFLLWLYDGARIIFDNISVYDRFINSVPFFTFEVLGAIAFVLSMLFMYLFLTTN